MSYIVVLLVLFLCLAFRFIWPSALFRNCGFDDMCLTDMFSDEADEPTRTVHICVATQEKQHVE